MSLVRPETAGVMVLDDDSDVPERALLQGGYAEWRAHGGAFILGLGASRGDSGRGRALTQAERAFT